MKRVFAAIKIKPEVSILNLIQELKLQFKYDRISWVKSENIHLTLKFFGEVDDEQIKNIKQIMEQVCINFKEFSFSLKGLGVFGSSYQPRVIWIGIKNNAEVKELANQLIGASSKIGFVPDRQNFVPHLTLARIKSIENKGRLKQQVNSMNNYYFQEVKVNDILLLESRLFPSGPVYSKIHTCDLKKPGNLEFI